MSDIFIQSIHIHKVRHLRNLAIPICDTTRKHLIITGKNGSGKTSVLEALKNQLIDIENGQLFAVFDKKNQIQSFEQSIYHTQKALETTVLAEKRLKLQREIDNYKNHINRVTEEIASKSAIEINLHDAAEAETHYKAGKFITAYFGAKREADFVQPKNIEKIALKETYKISEDPSKAFVQYMLYLKTQELFAKEDGDKATVAAIGQWFSNLTRLFRQLFNDPNLAIQFDRKELNFYIKEKNKPLVTFQQLSAGYSAILKIVADLLMRTENNYTMNPEQQGVVLIDELETHLHIHLQKMILPFLTKLFPKLQFIVATHSPFILNSIDNAVVFDLEYQFKVSDLSGYSAVGIIEGYFKYDMYSSVLKNKIEEYENLAEKRKVAELSEAEEEKWFTLYDYFENLPTFLAPELNIKIQQIKADYVL